MYLEWAAHCGILSQQSVACVHHCVLAGPLHLRSVCSCVVRVRGMSQLGCVGVQKRRRSICLYVHPSIRPFVHVSVCVCLCVSVCLCMWRCIHIPTN